MTPEQVYCVMDYETYSEADLEEVGAWEYSLHPSTDILCAAWRVGTREELKTAKTQWWAPSGVDTGRFGDLYRALMHPGIMLVAHNAFFEQSITRNVLATKHMYSKKDELQIGPERFICTMSLAAALSLPRGLGAAASALDLPVQKDKEGHALMLHFCKPRRKSKLYPGVRRYEGKPGADLKRLVEYCVTDVDTETALFLEVAPLSDKERKVWLLDQEVNLRGFQVDRPLVRKIIPMIAAAGTEMLDELYDITGGAVQTPGQSAKILKLIESDGYFLPNLKEESVVDALLDDEMPSLTRRVLEIRDYLSRSSLAKYPAFEALTRSDGRLRDALKYHAAGTGRWGGSKVQPQNLPRGTLKNLDQDVAAGMIKGGDLDFIRLCYGDPMAFFQNTLRGMIVAPRGSVLDVADYNAIEARVLFWLAGHSTGIKAFEDGRDLYKEIAGSIFNVDPSSVDSTQRFVGKSAILGCGFSMGGAKFKGTCKRQGGVEISLEVATAAVNAYRATHAPVVQLWREMENTAMHAMRNPKGRFLMKHGGSWGMVGKFLKYQLPSGRCISYYKPFLKDRMTPYGEMKPAIHFLSARGGLVEAHTYGGKLVENVVQACARDLLAEAMLRIEKDGSWRIVLHVHDEIVAERRCVETGATLERFSDLMERTPTWAAGLPVKVEGWTGKRYRK